MDINDRVYGKVKITEPVLVKLINSKPVQRLKGINQAGASQYATKGKTVSRYEHSVGVMILLGKLGAPPEEQIAGLLHDVPHTAFSHVIDFVFRSEDHAFHEKFHEKIIMSSEIPSILKEFGFDVERILDEKRFPLLERNLPDLCADRVDYTLRDMTASYGFHKKINEYVSSLAVLNNEIVMKNKDVAKRFASDYLEIDEKVWSNPLEVTLFQILADAIRIALDKKIICEDDLFGDDAFVYNKLKLSKDPQVLEKLAMLNPNLKIQNDPKEYQFHSISKLRYVDPKFIAPDGSIHRVTEEYSDFAARLAAHNRLMSKGSFVRVVSW